MKKILIFLLLLFLSALSFNCLAVNSSDIIINEIAWMGTITSANDEWIELYNNTQNPINLDGWQLIAQDGTPKINLSGIIPAKGFYLLERTDDNTVPGISADLIYTGALENSGEDLKLYDNLNNLIDEVNYQDNWPAGDNQTKQTMERGVRPGSDPGQTPMVPNDWQTSQEPGGTPKMANSKLEEVRPPLTPESVEVGPLRTYASGIIFNEILPSPEGPDEENEWIEIKNQNNFEIDLSGWKIRDMAGSIKTYTFPTGSKIFPFGFLVLKRPETKITLNNSGDGLELINPNGEIVDSATFEKAPLGQSYNKTQSGWAWSPQLTPGKENIISAPESSEQKTQTKEKPASSRSMRDSTDKEKTEDGPRNIEKQEANISLSSKNSNYPVILIALIIAVFSTGVILVLKKYINPVRG